MLLTEWNIEDAKKVWLEEGWEEGREQGREEGREEGRREIAKNLKAAGISPEFISQSTGLPVEEILLL